MSSKIGTREIRAWLETDSKAALCSMNVRSSEIQAWKNFEGLKSQARKFDRSAREEHHHDRGERVSCGKVSGSAWSATMLQDYLEEIIDQDPDDKQRRVRMQHLKVIIEDSDEENRWMDLLALADEIFAVPRDILGVYFNAKSTSLIKSKHGDDSKGTSVISFGMSFLSLIGGTMQWTPETIGNIRSPNASAIFSYLDWVFRGLGQILLCNNTLSGFIIFVAIFIQSAKAAFFSFASVLMATVSARIMGFDAGLIASGLFGYNAGLIGLAVASLHTGNSISAIIAVILLSVLSVIMFVSLSKVLLTYLTPPMTLPFDFLITMILLASASTANLNLDPVTPSYVENDTTENGLNFHAFFLITLRGIGQIVFASDIRSCILILLSLAICSRRMAIYALVGSALGSITAIFAGTAWDDISIGLYGYCPALTFIATEMFFVPSLGAHFLAVVGVFGSTILQAALTTLLGSSGLPVCSFPFSIISICVVLTQGDTKITIAVPLESVTIPEDHLRRVQVLKSGFALFLETMHAQGEGMPMRSNKFTKTSSFDDDISNSQKKNGGRRSGLTREVSMRMSLRKEAMGIMKSYSSIAEPANSIKSYSTLEEPAKSYDATDDGDTIDQWALSMFWMIGGSGDEYITVKEIEYFLTKIGLSDKKGQAFALDALSLFLLEIDQSIVKLDQWKRFCRCSWELGEVHELLANFFDFVDVNGDGYIQLDELDNALNYLGEPELRNDERKIISRISLDLNEFNINDMIIFVGAEMLKKLIQYHTQPGSGGSLQSTDRLSFLSESSYI